MAGVSNPEYLQTLLETFKCFICMEKIQDAHLCPHCSKLCCYACIRRWLTEQRSQCPHCRATLHLHEIVNCRWVEDLSEQLDCWNNSVDASNVRQTQGQKCETHNEQLTVYCITCNSTICHRCALFDSAAHNGHKFQPVEDIYNEALAQLGKSCDNLKKKEELIKADIKELDKNIIEVRQAKEQKVREIRSAVDCMMMDLEKDLNNKLTTLLSHKNHLLNESEQIEEFLNDCDLQVSRMPMSQLITNVPRFKRTIAVLQKKQPLILKTVYPDFHSELIPKFEGGNLVIKSFSEKMLLSEPVYSFPIDCNGVNWRLKVYPNGNGIVRDRYLSVFLELTSGPPGGSRYEYRIEMINQVNITDKSKCVLREFTSDFEIGECWGYNRFFRLDLLKNEGFLEQDTLILRFSVRSPTYYQKCREQQWYLSKLELEKSEILQQLEELKQKIPAKVKPVVKEIPSPEKKLKIKLQSLLEEFECTEAIGKLATNPNKDQEDQGASGETASNLVHPPLSVQTLYDNEYQNRFQGETAQSMFERLSRLFEETDNPHRSCSSPTDMNNVNDTSLNNTVKHPNQSECATGVTNALILVNPTMPENGTDLPHQTLIDHGLHNPALYKNEKTVNNVSQEISITNESNRFLNITDLDDSPISSIFPNYHFIDSWETINQNLSSDDEYSPSNESLGPDHLTRDE